MKDGVRRRWVIYYGISIAVHVGLVTWAAAWTGGLYQHMVGGHQWGRLPELIVFQALPGNGGGGGAGGGGELVAPDAVPAPGPPTAAAPVPAHKGHRPKAKASKAGNGSEMAR